MSSTSFRCDGNVELDVGRRLTDTPDPGLLADDHGLENARLLDVSLQTPRDVLHLVACRDLAEDGVGEETVADLVD